MADKKLDKSLDELISEKAKSGKSKGIRVGGQSSKIKIQRQAQKQPNKQQQQNGNKNGKQVHALDRALEVKNKKIGKQNGRQVNQNQRQNQNQPRQRVNQNQRQNQPRLGVPPRFPMPPPELLMPFGMIPMQGYSPLTQIMSGRLTGIQGGRGGGRGRGMGPGRGMGHPQIRPDPEAPGKWQNDMHNPLDMGPPRKGKPAGPPSVPNSRLKLTNLFYGVSDNDIKELFSSVGPLKAWEIDFDSSGRSLGTGLVEYYDANTASRALFQFNNVALDGQKISITIDDGLSPLNMLKSGIKVDFEEDYSRGARQQQGPGRILSSAMQQRTQGGGSNAPKQVNPRLRGVVRMAAADRMQE